MDFLKAFIVGGLICVVGQLIMDKTKLTNARIVVFFVVTGAILGAIGVYEKLVEFGGAGATVPITGFGYLLSTGVIKEVDKVGFLGIFTGGLKAAAGGITVAMVFSLVASFLAEPAQK